MKLSQEKEDFKPVTIVLESKSEVTYMRAIFAYRNGIITKEDLDRVYRSLRDVGALATVLSSFLEKI